MAIVEPRQRPHPMEDRLITTSIPMEETVKEITEKPLLNRLIDAVNFHDNINYRDPLGWDTLRDRWVNKTIGKDWREEQMSDIWDLLPDEWKPAVKEGATKFGQAFAKGWQDRRTIEGKEFLNPLAYTDFAITRGLETIGIPFEWMAQGISKASGLDIELARIATDFVPVAGIAGAVGKNINKARLAKVANRLSNITPDELVRLQSFADKAENISKRGARFDNFNAMFPDEVSGSVKAGLLHQIDPDNIPLSQRMADADLSQVPDDALDINIRRTKISDPEFYEKQLYRMRQWGMEDGVFDYFQFRTLKETKQKGPKSARSFSEFFQSIKEYADNYKGIVKYKRPEFEARWKDFLKARNIDPNAIQLHHIDLLQDSMGLYHNVQFDSDEWWDITATLLKANVRPGTTNWSRLKGKDNPNLRYVIGFAGQGDMPHGVAHKLYRAELDAKGFFSNEEILKMSVNPKYRIEKVKAFAKIVNRSEDILEQAMKTFNSLNPKGDMDYTATVNFLNTLNRDGLLSTKLIDGKYQVPQMKELILDIRKQMEDLPPTIRVDSETFEYWLLNKLLDYYGGVNPNILGGVRRRIKKRYGKKPL